MRSRQLAVEEELLLVDPETGLLTAVSDQALRAHESSPSKPPRGEPAPAVEQELFLQQIETGSVPCRDLGELDQAVRTARRAALDAARQAGAAAVAVASPVLGELETEVTPKPRYRRMLDAFGEVAETAIVCGMHVHVDVADDEEAVGVLDRIRPWLPVLLALSVNSPYWQGTDTGYASWRSQVWRRWPSAGQVEPFGDAAGYHAAVEELVQSGAVLDRGMLYFDARLAVSYPTVELRVADVCTEIDDAVLVAALSRALVETAARSWRRRQPPEGWRTELLRAASWLAARDGVAAQLVDPRTRRPAAARVVVEALVAHTREALDDSGDTGDVLALVERLLARGTGATRQRAVAEAHGGLAAVVEDLRKRTEAAASTG
jgi:glutamate---cysteine ligase / carboxylate-amine ligase